MDEPESVICSVECTTCGKTYNSLEEFDEHWEEDHLVNYGRNSYPRIIVTRKYKPVCRRSEKKIGKIAVPATKDIIQEVNGKPFEPEIRVWFHPDRVGQEGGAYYMVFPSFVEAMRCIMTHKETEKHPLIAYGGYEINIFGIE